MNILKLLDINDIEFAIKENLKYQIKELLSDTPILLDKVAFVNEGGNGIRNSVWGYRSLYCVSLKKHKR